MFLPKEIAAAWAPQTSGSSKFQEVRRTANSGRHHRMMQDSQLGEHCSLIPIETLAGHFAGSELNDTHESELGFANGGQPARNPIHVKRMGKANLELLDDPVVAEGLRKRGEFEIRWDFRQKLICVEIAHRRPARPGGPGRNGEDIRIFGHGRESRIRILKYEFRIGVLLPGSQHSLLVWR